MEKLKDYYCDKSLVEEFQDLFCDDIWLFVGKILEEREELSMDALFAQAALSSDEENGRGDSTRCASHSSLIQYSNTISFIPGNFNISTCSSDY